MDSEAVRRWIAQHPSEALHLFEAHLKPAVASATDATTITTTNTTTSRAGAAAIAAVSPTSPLSSAGSPTRLHHHTHEDGLQRLPADLLFYYYRSVHASLNLRTILSRVLSIAVTVVRAERCSVFLVDESKNELYSAAWNVGSRYLAPRPAASDDDDDDRASDSNGGSDSSSSRRTGTSARKRGKRSWSAMHSGEDLFNLPTKVSRMSSSAGLSHANAVVLTESSDDDVDGGGGGGRKGSGVASWSNEGGDGFRGNDHSAHGTANDGSAYHPLTTAAVDAADYADDEQMDDEETVRIPIGVGIAGTVAETKKGLNVADAYLYPGFNREIDARTGFRTKSVLCLPIFGGRTKECPRGRLIGVASLLNKIPSTSPTDGGPLYFNDEDVENFRDFLVTVGVAVENAKVYSRLKQQERAAVLEAQKSRELLSLARSLYVEESSSGLCKEIILRARDLTGADRASIFLVDNSNNTLYSTVFDGSDSSKIVIPMNRGVAGYVATTGVLVNLPDAYEDPRFDSKTDKSTGYRTQSLLCCPIFGPSKNIVGVAVLLNKIMPKTKAIVPFPATDVELFQGFAAFCGLALHRTLTYEELQRQRQKLAVAIDIMAYHTVAHDDDVQRFAVATKNLWSDAPDDPAPDHQPSSAVAAVKSTMRSSNSLDSLAAANRNAQPAGGACHYKGRPFTIDLLREPFFDPHYFSPTDDRLAATVCRMFNDLGFPSVFSIPSETVSLYVLTVRKNYRPVAYHNFTHAVSVVHGLYMMLSRGLLQPFSFDVVDAFAMFLAALNHDIDHRGTNNAFQKTAATALASFYSSSIMERHHFNHAMSILNTSGLNILDKVPSKDYKRCLSTFEHCILATDLAVYFKTKQAVNDLAAAGNYDSANPEHKNLLLGILMTCTDLSSMYKEWDDVQHTADAVYSEFFAQGHEEKKLGVPISAPVMDPDNEPEIPRLQVGFYASIVTPAYESLCALLGPRADFLLEGVRKNENKWRELMLSGVPYRIGAMHDVSATTTTTNGDHGDGDAGGAS